MTGWIRFDNTTSENLKVEPISDRAFRLWFNASCYCSRNETDGRVPASTITRLSRSATIRTVEELIGAGLMHRLDDGTYLIHDYLDYNPSRGKLDAMRERGRERSAKWRGVTEEGDGDGVSDGVSTGELTRHPRGRDRSDTDTDSVVVPSSTSTAKVTATRRPSKTVDPDAPPDGFDTGLRSALDAAVPRFAALWEQRGGEKPTVRSVAVAIAGRPDRDHLSVLTDLERWALVGGGANREIADWGRTFATFLRKAPVAAPSRPAGNGSAVNGMRSREQRRADGLAALDSLIANGGAQ